VRPAMPPPPSQQRQPGAAQQPVQRPVVSCMVGDALAAVWGC
jgi:hypothetical protein